MKLRRAPGGGSPLFTNAIAPVAVSTSVSHYVAFPLLAGGSSSRRDHQREGASPPAPQQKYSVPSSRQCPIDDQAVNYNLHVLKDGARTAGHTHEPARILARIGAKLVRGRIDQVQRLGEGMVGSVRPRQRQVGDSADAAPAGDATDLGMVGKHEIVQPDLVGLRERGQVSGKDLARVSL